MLNADHCQNIETKKGEKTSEKIKQQKKHKKKLMKRTKNTVNNTNTHYLSSKTRLLITLY